jgi:hypothetical protein
MLSDFAVMTLAAMIVAAATFGLIALAVEFMQRLLEMGQFLQRPPFTRAKNFAVSEVPTLTPARELVGD